MSLPKRKTIYNPNHHLANAQRYKTIVRKRKKFLRKYRYKKISVGKAVNKELAKAISGRIDEILDLTGLTLTGLANFTAVGEKAIRSYHSRTLPISVEIVHKLCAPFSITLRQFFDFDSPLQLSKKGAALLDEYRQQLFHKRMGYFKEEKDAFIAKPKSTGPKRERESIAYAVKQTDYFAEGKSIAQIIVDFNKEYDLQLESGRVYDLLKKYVGNELDRVATPKTNQDGLTSKREVFLYYRRKNS